MITNDISIEGIKALGEYLEFVPYDVTRKDLYNADTLYQGYNPKSPETREECYDSNVYNYYIKTGKHAYSAKETLARCLHDYGIGRALDTFLTDFDPKSVVGIMGGHALLRTDALYKEIVQVSKRLTEEGFLMISGGGPGAMEATHLGAWMAGYSQADVNAVVHRLGSAPDFNDEAWLRTAFEVIRDYPQTRYKSLSIPTWLYGHEPSTPFATHIAKYFDNSIREDNILTYAFGGIIYSPGSAGTIQEIFQDAVQNHYLSFGFASPMVFLGTRFWTQDMPIYPLLQNLAKTGKYKNLLLSNTDRSDDIINTLLDFRHNS